MSDLETLLKNESGSIVTDGPFVLICDCPGGLFVPFIRLVSGIAIVLSIIISTIVALRAAPALLISIAIAWTIGAIVANVLVNKELRKHGIIRIDTEREQIVQQGRSFSQTFPFRDIVRISTPIVSGIEGNDSEPGFEDRWLLVRLTGERELRLGKGPMHELRPAFAFLRKAGVPGIK